MAAGARRRLLRCCSTAAPPWTTGKGPGPLTRRSGAAGIKARAAECRSPDLHKTESRAGGPAAARGHPARTGRDGACDRGRA
eukprot:CAMPEP_0204534596 /NCGR_PEP_ID=MMETSP0661-20131031/13074_1 /ASSEMBLY_ACC=CAM_ASM_000606 /TAXON_ID=109239 /ORGANISM="Alexandrium margalefi, Strain AMGDE01CS-322" /LENGTH=81 /DNA_ID=CAMNT_0051541057 /DNA_START=129 /DNA_END=370 /DNA_ORIENTATION=+